MRMFVWRYEYLGVKDIYINCSMKIRTWEEFLKKYRLQEDEIIYVGDDIPDYEVMKRAGCPCCPKTLVLKLKRYQLILVIAREDKE